MLYKKYYLNSRNNPVLISDLLKGTFWSLEAGGMWCRNSTRTTESSKKPQLACQNRCEALSRLDCVGIVVSANTKYCYLCEDDVMASSGNGEGFYRRPGIFSIYFALSIFNFYLFIYIIYM